MSKETSTWLRENVRVGFTEERGAAWWGSADDGAHYPGPVPLDEAVKILGKPVIVSAKLGAQFTLDAGSAARIHRQPGEVINYYDPERQAMFRIDTPEPTILGVFKGGYTKHDYVEWGIEKTADVLDTFKGDLGIASVGLLRDGGVAWIQIQTPENFSHEGFPYRPWYSFATSVDGSLSSTPMYGIDAIVCDNTLDYAVSSGTTRRTKIRHTKNSGSRIQEIRDKLGLVLQVSETFEREMDKLLAIKVDTGSWAKFLNAYAPIPEAKTTKSGSGGRSYTMAINKRDVLTKLYRSDPRVAPWSGTAFGVVQAVNTYVTHEGIVRGASRAERNIDRMVTGEMQDLDREIFETLTGVLA